MYEWSFGERGKREREEKPWSATLIEHASFVCLEHTADTDPFQAGLFGKGSLSRSQPTWKSRVLDAPDKDTVFLEHITEQRRQQKRNHDNATSSASGLWSTEEIRTMVDNYDYEQIMLDFYEAFFLRYALNTLVIYDASNKRLSIDDCWTIFSNRTPLFATRYAAYHYYRSLGWAPKQGSKFGVDFGNKWRYLEQIKQLIRR
ncbi:hypothetical protein BJV82DRAFT_577285 [Fennellomyces sp. T-0311]|nr:hypothetical protein BJV82DRAFT_577285 [Fennellomyces sp. T-0311]